MAAAGPFPSPLSRDFREREGRKQRRVILHSPPGGGCPLTEAGDAAPKEKKRKTYQVVERAGESVQGRGRGGRGQGALGRAVAQRPRPGRRERGAGLGGGHPVAQTVAPGREHGRRTPVVSGVPLERPPQVLVGGSKRPRPRPRPAPGVKAGRAVGGRGRVEQRDGAGLWGRLAPALPGPPCGRRPGERVPKSGGGRGPPRKPAVAGHDPPSSWGAEGERGHRHNSCLVPHLAAASSNFGHRHNFHARDNRTRTRCRPTARGYKVLVWVRKGRARRRTTERHRHEKEAGMSSLEFWIRHAGSWWVDRTRWAQGWVGMVRWRLQSTKFRTTDRRNPNKFE